MYSNYKSEKLLFETRGKLRYVWDRYLYTVAILIIYHGIVSLVNIPSSYRSRFQT